MADLDYDSNKTFAAAVERSKKIEEDIVKNPSKYRVLTGDRPTGRLHIGHYFGSLQNRVKLSKMGVPTMILIADYQVLTDHDAFNEISQNTKQLVIDYLAAGIEPGENVIIYPHSYVPEANQLMLHIHQSSTHRVQSHKGTDAKRTWEDPRYILPKAGDRRLRPGHTTEEQQRH